MTAAITAEALSKEYRLGQLNRRVLLREALANVIRNLRRRAEGEQTLWALRDVSFRVEEGEVVGIIGRNGAGKSTLLKILSRITYPTSGSMSVRGRLASLLEVGTGFHEELTGRENIYLNGSILGMRKREIDQRMDSIVEFADVEKFLDTPVKRYSSGMRLRLGFAVAAHLDPDVLLVDEVLAVGDAGFQKKCLGAMSHLHAGGRTVLFVSHNLTAVENLCRRTIWIDQGRIRADGDSREVIQSYLATFTEASCFQTDLTRIEHRKGSGEARFTRIEFLDAAGRPVECLRSGMSVTIRLHYEIHRRVLEPHFGFEIYTNTGTLVTSINTWTTGYNLEMLEPGRGHIDVRVDTLNLNPDRYHVSLWLASVGPKYYDHLELALTLDIEPADVHNSGRSMAKYFGLVFLPCQWHNHEGSDGMPYASADEALAGLTSTSGPV
jgi:lipopolysaccharide transport system ATP-binding protein